MLVEQPVTLSRDEARNIYAAESPRLTINWERNTLNQVIGGAWIRYVGGIFESSGRLSLGAGFIALSRGFRKINILLLMSTLLLIAIFSFKITIGSLPQNVAIYFGPGLSGASKADFKHIIDARELSTAVDFILRHNPAFRTAHPLYHR